MKNIFSLLEIVICLKKAPSTYSDSCGENTTYFQRSFGKTNSVDTDSVRKVSKYKSKKRIPDQMPKHPTGNCWFYSIEVL